MSWHEQLLKLPLYRSVHARSVLARVHRLARKLARESDAALRNRSLDLRYRIKTGEPPSAVLAEGLTLVREACRRITGKSHYDVQLLAGVHLVTKCVVEMATGEGKTLTAMLPLYLYGLTGKGAHLATANDYLARRDAETTRPVLEFLGLSVGVVQDRDSDESRRAAYKCDITYGTCTQFGFDFLRDRMRGRVVRDEVSFAGGSIPPQLSPVGRAMHFILVDEADSVMIDDANTPLIIGATSSARQDKTARLCRWAAEYAPRARERADYRVIEHAEKIELTEQGRAWIRDAARETKLTDCAIVDLYETVQRAIKVERDYVRDRNYVVRNGEATIVDNNTGRLSIGRLWQDGIHQAIQAREGLEITVPTAAAAQVTIQSLILSYPHRAGMTGTAWQSRREFRKVYKMGVVRVPTRLPSRRSARPTIFRRSEAAKMQAIRDEVLALRRQGRAVLIGTRSVSKSERLSAVFTAAQIPHVVLNARREAEEADIVARAGEVGAVTIATNMAGRGTDIQLADSVKRAGGLHVILAELNDSARIDRQLIGRCARQGEPGSYRLYLSEEDHILDPKQRTDVWKNLLRSLPILPARACFRGAQTQIDRKNLRNRLAMLFHEKKRLRLLKQAGLDPVLDVAD